MNRLDTPIMLEIATEAQLEQLQNALTDTFQMYNDTITDYIPWSVEQFRTLARKSDTDLNKALIEMRENVNNNTQRLLALGEIQTNLADAISVFNKR